MSVIINFVQTVTKSPQYNFTMSRCSMMLSLDIPTKMKFLRNNKKD